MAHRDSVGQGKALAVRLGECVAALDRDVSERELERWREDRCRQIEQGWRPTPSPQAMLPLGRAA